MKTKYYTLEDLGLAKWILRTVSLGHRQCDLIWAEKVVGWYDVFFRIAKTYKDKYLGLWSESIKFLWSQIKGFTKASELYDLLGRMLSNLKIHFGQKVSVRKTYRQTNHSLYSMDEFKAYRIKSKPKTAFMVRLRNKVSYIALKAAKGIATL